MKPGHFQNLTGALLMAASLGMAAPAFADKYDVAVGKVMAASVIAERCKGLGPVGDGSDNGFVEAAIALLVGDGMRRNPLAMRLYYADTASLQAIALQEIAARGVDAANKTALCRFGKSVVGTDDGIGRFLVKGD